MDEFCTDGTELEDKPDRAESHEDDFTIGEAFGAGVFAGFAYEEGLRARKRKKRKRFGDDHD
jgi:hypothetical protein